MRARRTSGPGACKGMAGFARHALVLGSPSGEAASYMSYWSYMSYRGVYQSANQLISQSAGRSSALWHVADVPGVQGLWEAWEFRGLEAWLFYPSPHPSPRRGALCSLFTVFCSLGRVSALPCRGGGPRPTSLPINFPIRQDTFLGNHRDARDGHGSEAQRAER